MWILPFLPVNGVLFSSRYLRCRSFDSLGGLSPNSCALSSFVEIPGNIPVSIVFLYNGRCGLLEFPSEPHPLPSLDKVELESTEEAAESVELFEFECSRECFSWRLKYQIIHTNKFKDSSRFNSKYCLYHS